MDGEQAIFDCVGQALERTIKIRRSGVDEEVVIEAFWNQTPAADQGIAQDQRGVIPYKAVPQRRRVDCDYGEEKNSYGKTSFHAALRPALLPACSIKQATRCPGCSGERTAENSEWTFSRGCTSKWGMITAKRGCILLGLWLLVSNAHADGVPPECTQLIVAVAPDWNSMHGQMQLFERTAAGSDWTKTGPPFPVLFGKNGTAWGSGLAGQNEPGLRKKERDGRAPAGVFRIGRIYTYDARLPNGSDFPFHQVTTADAWVDDMNSPDYNRFVTIDNPAQPPPWFEKQKMRHNDFAYRWLVEIRHNSDPPMPGNGSAIFFHIRRGVNRPTAGCTTMAERDLVHLIRWLRANRHPCYALLPRQNCESLWQTWDLPNPDQLPVPQ